MRHSTGLKKKRLSEFAYSFLIIVIGVFIVFMFEEQKTYGEDDVRKADSLYFHELERRYEAVLKDTLDKEGYTNAGITFVSQIDSIGKRKLYVRIHHHKFDSVNEKERERITAYISDIAFSDNKTPVICSFN